MNINEISWDEREQMFFGKISGTITTAPLMDKELKEAQTFFLNSGITICAKIPVLTNTVLIGSKSVTYIE